MEKLTLVLLCVVVVCGAKMKKFELSDEIMHKVHHLLTISTRIGEDEQEKTAEYWINEAQNTLNNKLKQEINTNKAKNIILFLGDGMSIPTLAATRAYISQLKDQSGTEQQLSFDQFPFSGLSKTYCVDRQVADSASTATAYLCGVKANYATIGVTGNVELDDCRASMDSSNRVYSIAKWAQEAGKATGIVTTARVTHASPAGVYAHVANREWESDFNVRNYSQDSSQCDDIARQLVFGETGRDLNVVLGGGRAKFLPFYALDEEGDFGERLDGVDLIDEWLEQRQNDKASYVWNRQQLLEKSKSSDYLLGLFESSHCKYNLERDPTADPTLEEMTEAAIKVLQKEPNGFFLFVEGGRIDHAHHGALAQKALDETVQFSSAIEKAIKLTSRRDTLIVVTSDHSHTMSFSGYAQRGNDILGTAGNGQDGIPYATLSYANGPGYTATDDEGNRLDPSSEDMQDINYRFPSTVPLEAETHGGDDVGVFALGPWAHLFSGVIEENVIPHAMAYAACIGNGVTFCDRHDHDHSEDEGSSETDDNNVYYYQLKNWWNST